MYMQPTVDRDGMEEETAAEGEEEESRKRVKDAEEKRTKRNGERAEESGETRVSRDILTPALT